MDTLRRLVYYSLACILLSLLGVLLVGCVPSVGGGGGVALVTPYPHRYEYRWVMEDAGDDWGVQVGPKYDGAGLHVSVYGWLGCHPKCQWEFYQTYDSLTAGSIHLYDIRHTVGGWAMMYDGRVLAVLDPGTIGGRWETGDELTTQ